MWTQNPSPENYSSIRKQWHYACSVHEPVYSHLHIYVAFFTFQIPILSRLLTFSFTPPSSLCPQIIFDKWHNILVRARTNSYVPPPLVPKFVFFMYRCLATKDKLERSQHPRIVTVGRYLCKKIMQFQRYENIRKIVHILRNCCHVESMRKNSAFVHIILSMYV